MDQPTIFATTESAKSAFKNDQPDRDRLSRTLAEMDVGLNSISFEHAYTRFRLAEARAGGLNETQLRSIIDDVVTGTEILEGVAESFR